MILIILLLMFFFYSIMIKVKKCILCVRTLLTVLQCVCFEWLQNFESMILTLIFYGTAQTLGSSLAQPTFFEFFSSIFLTMFENFQNIRKNFHFCKKMTEKVIFLTFFYFSQKKVFFFWLFFCIFLTPYRTSTAGISP